MNRQVALSLVIALGVIAGVYTYFSDRAPTPKPAPARVPDSQPAPARDTSAPAAKPAAPDSGLRTRDPGPRTVRPAPAAPDVVVAPAPTTATLRITSDVPGAQVFIDRKFVGNAPVTAEDVAPGSRQINVSAPGYEGVAETLDVAPGPRDVMISLKTIKLDQSIAVVHKHRAGSCTGRLIATPEGLRYETENKDDGFTVPLTGLETFTTDFAAKSLKVKIRSGRSYDFTDAGGRAEPLYFFHQAVDKVRRRLAGGGPRSDQ